MTLAEPRTIEIELPLWRNKPPLTANQRLHWRDRWQRTKRIRTSTALQARSARIGACQHITVTLHYRPGDNRRRDAPNLWPSAKPAVDGLRDANVIPDDTPAYVTEWTPVIHPGPGERRLWLAVQVDEAADKGTTRP